MHMMITRVFARSSPAISRTRLGGRLGMTLGDLSKLPAHLPGNARLGWVLLSFSHRAKPDLVALGCWDARALRVWCIIPYIQHSFLVSYVHNAFLPKQEQVQLCARASALPASSKAATHHHASQTVWYLHPSPLLPDALLSTCWTLAAYHWLQLGGVGLCCTINRNCKSGCSFRRYNKYTAFLPPPAPPGPARTCMA